jgi:type VI secretion system protein ImpC
LGSLAQALNVPLVAESAASLLGTPAIAEQPDPRDWAPLGPEIEATWNALRASPSARSIGLALPRFLLRLPYGAKSDPIETFRFEEQPPTPEHESFLWGCPALACAAVLARVLQAEVVSADMGDIAGLPTFLVEVDDEPRLQPGAEVCLSERAIDAILARGVMPVVGFKDRDVARLVRLQSIADPPTALLR